LTSRGDLTEKLSYAFDVYDIDQNGYIDLNELNAILLAMFSLMKWKKDEARCHSLAQMCMKKLDTDGDSQISKDEFISGLLNNYNLRVLLSPFS
jgi:Ca2+-binding EF-hand superfamily protein